MSPTLAKVIEITSERTGVPVARLSAHYAIDQDLNIYGDYAEEFVVALVGAFGDWIVEWPWLRFVDFNEPGFRFLPKLWKFLKLPNAERAFPGIAHERLELGHIAAVIDNGQWFDP